MGTSLGSAGEPKAVARGRGQGNRSAARKGAFIWGRVITASGRERDCIVLDQSSTGARIRLQDAKSLAGYVQVIGSGGEQREAEVVWTRTREAGLRYGARPEARLEPIFQAIADRLNG